METKEKLAGYQEAVNAGRVGKVKRLWNSFKK